MSLQAGEHPLNTWRGQKERAPCHLRPFPPLTGQGVLFETSLQSASFLEASLFLCGLCSPCRVFLPCYTWPFMSLSSREVEEAFPECPEGQASERAPSYPCSSNLRALHLSSRAFQIAGMDR